MRQSSIQSSRFRTLGEKSSTDRSSSEDGVEGRGERTGGEEGVRVGSELFFLLASCVGCGLLTIKRGQSGESERQRSSFRAP